MGKKINCIECVLYIISVILTIWGAHFIYGTITPDTNVHCYLLACAIAGTIIVIISFISLIHYYFREEATKNFKSVFDKIGQDITSLFSWFFSVNGFLFIILCAIVALIVFFICSFYGESVNNTNVLELTALTLTISLASVLPAIITKVIAEKAIESKIDEKLDKKLEIHKITLTEHMNIILKETAHSSRMFADLLYQMATQQKDLGKTEEALKNLFWSIGWGSKAITQYLIIKDDYSSALSLSRELLKGYILNSQNIIIECENALKVGESDWPNSKKGKNLLRSRDLKSVFQVHALIQKYGVLEVINDSEIEDLNVKNKLRELETLMLGFLNESEYPSAKDCRLKELNNEDNDKLEDIARSIIKEAKKKAGIVD